MKPGLAGDKNQMYDNEMKHAKIEVLIACPSGFLGHIYLIMEHAPHDILTDP